MNSSKAKKAAKRARASDLLEMSSFADRLNSDAIFSTHEFQADFVSRRFRLAPELASAVAALAFMSMEAP